MAKPNCPQLDASNRFDVSSSKAPPVVKRNHASKPARSHPTDSSKRGRRESPLVAPAKFGAFAKDCSAYFQDLALAAPVRRCRELRQFLGGSVASRCAPIKVETSPPTVQVEFANYWDKVAGYRLAVSLPSSGFGWHVWRTELDCQNLVASAREDPLVFAHCPGDLAERRGVIVSQSLSRRR